MKELRSEWLRNWCEVYNKLCWELTELSIPPFLVVFFCFNTHRHTLTNVPHQLQCYQKESQMNTRDILETIPCIHHFSSLKIPCMRLVLRIPRSVLCFGAVMY